MRKSNCLKPVLRGHKDMGVERASLDDRSDQEGSTPQGTLLSIASAADWPHIRILVASGGVMPEAGDMPAGGVFISKPFTADVIYEHPRSILTES